MSNTPYPTSDVGALISLVNAGNVTVSSPDQNNTFSRGLIATVNLSNVVAGTVTVKIQGKDVASGKYYDLLDSAALAGNGTTELTVYPGVAASANVAANSPLPAVWRATAVVSASGNITGTVGASVIA